MLGAYLVVFVLGLIVGAVANDLAHRWRQRRITHKLLQALDAGDVKIYRSAARSNLLEDDATGPT